MKDLPQGCAVPILVEIGPLVLEKKMIMLIIYNNEDNDDNKQRTNCDQISSLEPMVRRIGTLKNALLQLARQ